MPLLLRSQPKSDVLLSELVKNRTNGVESLSRIAALHGTAEIGLAVAATTFSIVAVFVPVAFMPGVSGEWFRPFALTVVASVMVSLFISFTLDPMLSAFWGDPPGAQHAPRKGISRWLTNFNTWFDHQADRYGKVIAWALHHRVWMFVFTRCMVSYATAKASAAFGSCRTSSPSAMSSVQTCA